MTRIEIVPVGNLGNRMLQVLLLESIKRHAPGLSIGNIDLPEWGLTNPTHFDFKGPRLRLKGQHVDIPLLIRWINEGRIGDLEFAALGFQVKHYMPKADCAKLFPPQVANATPIRDNELLINVRGAEILQNTHEDYGPLPIAFYRQVIEETGLEPVFMGQIGTDPCSNLLRETFPGARFMPSLGVMEDFELLRNARHVVACVSSFSWLATWLSDAQTIHLPVCGIFHPLQRPDIDLLPANDARYRFYRFPVRRWTASAEQFADLSKTGDFPELGPDDLHAMRKTAERGIRFKRMAYRVKFLTALLAHRTLGRGAWIGL